MSSELQNVTVERSGKKSIDQSEGKTLTIYSRVAAIVQTPPTSQQEEPPEGYYAFIESPNAEPPRVRPPPYTYPPVDCKEDDNSPHALYFNICGDLNKGSIPRNPMGQNVLGSPYPFELIRNQTLKYLSRTLPILKADETLPKVAQFQDDLISDNSISNSYDKKDRSKRSATEELNATNKSDTSDIVGSRQGRKFCDQGGVFCMLYKAINGEFPTTKVTSHLPAERRDDASTTRYEGPPTPCPAKVEYATPVFAKNYQGIWRYVVQIPYEGYFTQTIEVTRYV
ncbi:hypothetical protein FQR65_LT09043 [Abscondita terminalis]|nr:hypothetical protein FQR65_LT09043 [Abscondita terminalis]